MANKNSNLHQAKSAKNDEFYTQLTDIEKEMMYYKNFFKGKVVLCNCNDMVHTNFAKYFSLNFEHLGLKKLICTAYKIDGVHGKVCIYEGDKNGNLVPDIEEWKQHMLNGDGSFDSEECIEFLKECDVVVTNPAFSLFRRFVKTLFDYGKKFLIMSNNNAITYKEFFPFFKEKKVWLGRTLFTGKMPYFKVPDDYPMDNERFIKKEDGLYKQVNAICWFTNIPNDSNRESLCMFKKYTPEEYPQYDNYNAIECGRMENLPYNYNGIIGIPITGLKYLWSDGTIHTEDNNGEPTQFEIIGIMSGAKGEPFTNGNDNRPKFYVNNKGVYARILIKRIV